MAGANSLVQKSLLELYQTGKEHVIRSNPDEVLEEGEEPSGVKVWLKKLSSVEKREAVTYAHRKSAPRQLLQKADRDDEEKAPYYSSIANLERDDMLMWIVEKKLGGFEDELAAELAESEDWKDHDLESLLSVWVDGGLRDRFMDGEELSGDDKRVVELLEQFEAEVGVRKQEILNTQRELYVNKSQAEVEDEIVNLLIENDANAIWMEHFYAYRVFLGVRMVDKRKVKVFDSIEVVLGISDELMQELTVGFEELEVGSSVDVKG